MSYVFRRDLKIEFRAVPYLMNSTHVLEYRIIPDQDLTYEENVSWLWGLIKFKRQRKFSTKWVRAEKFVNYSTAYLYTEDHNYLPIFISDRNEFEKYKCNYKTIGDFFDMINQNDTKEKTEWLKERNAYNDGIWE